MYTEITKCRICGNNNLTPVLDLGKQQLTGVFPKDRDAVITSGPLELVLCTGLDGGDHCGLLQLRHSYDLSEMYGLNYGYRSGLNQSMVSHLHGKVQKIRDRVSLKKGDLIIDIGSNDSTLLQAYPSDVGLDLVGIDPTGAKFGKYYPPHVSLISDFFSASVVQKAFGERKAKIITSISMFYDLESPMDFMAQVRDSLADDGIWVFEQSYMPTMLDVNAYDTVCHEHLEYYSLRQIQWMTERIGFRIIDVELNDINGGSFSVAVAKRASQYREAENIDELLRQEHAKGLASLQPYKKFAAQVSSHKEELLSFLQSARHDGKVVMGLGASTKGNVILQYCGITEHDLPCIGDVNPDKFGCYTPGSMVPIISESKVLEQNPYYLLVFPWHFKEFFLSCHHLRARNLVFPLPKLEIVTV